MKAPDYEKVGKDLAEEVHAITQKYILLMKNSGSSIEQAVSMLSPVIMDLIGNVVAGFEQDNLSRSKQNDLLAQLVISAQNRAYRCLENDNAQQ